MTVPLQYEFQLNGRISLDDVEGDLVQTNLVTKVDIFNVNGESVADADVNTSAVESAILAVVAALKTIPAS